MNIVVQVLVVVLVAVCTVVVRPLVLRNCRRVGIDDFAVDPWWVAPLCSAVIAAVAAWCYRDTFTQMIVVLAAAPLLAWCAWIDVRTHRVPTITAYAVSGIVAVTGVLSDVVVDGGSWSGWVSTWLIGLAAGAVLLVLALVTGGRGVGAADVRMAVPLGVLVGYHGWPALWSMFVITYLVAVPVAIANIIRRRRNPDIDAGLPFVPALVVGAVAALTV